MNGKVRVARGMLDNAREGDRFREVVNDAVARAMQWTHDCHPERFHRDRPVFVCGYCPKPEPPQEPA
jgi:hypothetical protein